MSKGLVIGVGVGASGVLWYMYRKSQRDQLVELMKQSPQVTAARAYALSVNLTPKFDWLKEEGGLEAKAAELITLTGLTTTTQAYDSVLKSLPKLPDPSMLADILNDGLASLEEQLGIQLPQSMKQELRGATQGEKGQAADSALTSLASLWAATFGSSAAKTNPSLSWDEFLGGLS